MADAAWIGVWLTGQVCRDPDSVLDTMLTKLASAMANTAAIVPRTAVAARTAWVLAHLGSDTSPLPLVQVDRPESQAPQMGGK